MCGKSMALPPATLNGIGHGNGAKAPPDGRHSKGWDGCPHRRSCDCVRLHGIDTVRSMHRAFASLGSTVAALLVAVLLIVPVADAFACAFDSDAGHADAGHAVAVTDEDASPSSGEEDGKGGKPDGAHVCAHNHCHHPAANIFFVTRVDFDPRGVARPDSPARNQGSGPAEGPRRPPRS